MRKLSLPLAMLALGTIGCNNDTHKRSAETPEARDTPTSEGASKPAEDPTRGQYVERYRNGFALVRYSGALAKEFSPVPGMEPEAVAASFARAGLRARPSVGRRFRKATHDINWVRLHEHPSPQPDQDKA